MVHALAAIIPYVVPEVMPTLGNEAVAMMIEPTFGFDSILTENPVIGEITDYEAEFTPEREQALKDYYAADPSPYRAGQVIAYDHMFFRVRDGFNCQGDQFGCVGGLKYCPIFADYTDYDPVKGQRCAREPIV